MGQTLISRLPSLRVGRTPDQSQSVTPLELFYDLVYIFAVGQLSHHLLTHLDWKGAAETGILLVGVFAVWAFTSWACSLLDTSRLPVRAFVIVTLFLGMILNTSLDDAFGDRGWLFVTIYLACQVSRSIFIVFAGVDGIMQDHFFRMLGWAVVSSPLWIIGAVVDGPSRLLLWGIAAVIDVVATLLSHPGIRRRTETRNYEFAGEYLLERCRLFFLIALGETVITSATVFTQTSLDGLTLLALLVAITGTTAIWWSYFVRSEEEALDVLEETDDEAQIGRKAIYAIAVMLAGLVLVAVGDELSISHPDGKPSVAASIMLFGGPALYVLAQAVFQKRTKGRAVASRPIALIAFVIGGVVSLLLPTLAAATLATVIMVGVAVHDSLIEAREKSDRTARRDASRE
ncbi:low temperature requirement protein A [Lacisediminihabitans sp. FW035]